MEIDTRFPTKLNSLSEVPEPFRAALVESFPSGEPARLLLYAPAFPTEDEKSSATVLAVTNTGWLIALPTEDAGVALEKSDFSDTLFLELTPVLLECRLRILFAAEDAPRSVAISFETVGEDLYREAIDLILAGIDPKLTAAAEQNRRDEALMLEGWPLKIRNEARRFWPGGQRLVDAIQWPAVFDASQRQLAPACALLITERELVVISDEQKSSEEPLAADELEESFAGIITFVPRVRLAEFQVNCREQCAFLALQVKAAHGEEKLEYAFPSGNEAAVSKAMEQMLRPGASRDPANQAGTEIRKCQS
ncbi:MAG: hypothetical protein JO279_17545 [Verrucomicrobia bacterium]|nr:hypothetical protein [Verrucomicrobiota bacterium]